MSLITLTTDFGVRDGYPGVMKGVIYGISPESCVIDLTHEIAPQNISEGAFVLAAHFLYFPVNTVHVVVVDPGVGTERRAIAASVSGQFFVAPDNGILTPVFRQAKSKEEPLEIIQLDNPHYWLSEVSATFHGRDIFAPVGAHLAAGVPLEQLGTQIDDPVFFEWPEPRPKNNGVNGEIIYIDRFGNAISNIRASSIAHIKKPVVSFRNRTAEGLVKTFGEGMTEELIALWDSSKYLMVTQFGGLKNLKPKIGEKIKVRESE